MIIQCSECIYWLPEENNNFGQCRRLPPAPEVAKSGGSPFIGHANYRAIWLYTRDVDGCGEGRAGKRQMPKEEIRNQTSIREEKKTPQSFDDMVRKARVK